MPITTDIQQLILDNQAYGPSNRRLVILTDRIKKTSVYGYFDLPSDTDASLTALGYLFDDSFAFLSKTDLIIYTPETLPLLRHIGRYAETLITKEESGFVRIQNGLAKPIDAYLGVE